MISVFLKYLVAWCFLVTQALIIVLRWTVSNCVLILWYGQIIGETNWNNHYLTADFTFKPVHLYKLSIFLYSFPGSEISCSPKEQQYMILHSQSVSAKMVKGPPLKVRHSYSLSRLSLWDLFLRSPLLSSVLSRCSLATQRIMVAVCQFVPPRFWAGSRSDVALA